MLKSQSPRIKELQVKQLEDDMLRDYIIVMAISGIIFLLILLVI